MYPHGGVGKRPGLFSKKPKRSEFPYRRNHLRPGENSVFPYGEAGKHSGLFPKKPKRSEFPYRRNHLRPGIVPYFSMAKPGMLRTLSKEIRKR